MGTNDIFRDVNEILEKYKECVNCDNCEYRYYWNMIGLCQIKTLRYKLEEWYSRLGTIEAEKVLEQYRKNGWIP